jgi:asparagine N-glycosylation enzyme membrane subunit Stt3
MTKHIKEKWVILGGYVIFIFSLIFSRYSQNSILNGSSFISQAVYGGGILLFAIVLAGVYLKAKKENEELLFDKSLILLVALFFFGAISARGAIRLFILLAIPAPILVGFGAVKLVEYAKQAKDDIKKIIMWVAAGLFIFFLIFSLSKSFPFLGMGVIPSFEQQTYYEAKYTVPNAYTMQWQEAMAWVRDETPKDSVFAHWWDYGYWLQSIGERATIIDGGNLITYWDHLMGRHVLTGQNETEALEFLKSHGANYLLIDSSDIGKYPAYSSIGSDENYDRYSWVNTFLVDEKSSKETRNETIYLYRGSSMNDADIMWEGHIIPAQSAGIVGFMLPVSKIDGSFSQPQVVMIYNNQQINIPIKCLYFESENERYSFDNGLDSCLYIIPAINANNISNIGAALYISERGMNALWTKLYLFDETEAKNNETKSFELAHNEDDLFVSQLRQNYNLTLPDIIFYQDIRGPIKIWKINYPANIQTNPDYLKTVFPDVRLETPRGV